jgi:imidazole glycerol phosphate synthase glutamine amidotransferase subunit
VKCAIIDYGTGTIQSVHNAISTLGHSVYRSRSDDFDQADVVIFPGQGAFGPAMAALNAMGIRDSLKAYIQSGRPFIGICLGFQLLFDGSDESPGTQGLCVKQGHFKLFSGAGLSVPHMGWNALAAPETPSVLSAFEGHYFYFVHSFYLPVPDTPIPGMVMSNYGGHFIAAIATSTQLMVQFHPEKSGESGLQLLELFLKGVA